MDDHAGKPASSSSAAVAEQAVPLPPLISERPGKRVGRYKLLEHIGEGGYGVVFLAEQQEPVRRLVALKVIKPGMDTRSVVARFEAERQALAILDHPCIAKVLDGGATDSGRPYFVMELVRGPRITDYCDDHNLSTGQRLGLFTQVCHAIQHAHQKGIIHRDIKPSNVLVAIHDGVATPKVIDFGIAKATGERLTDKTFLTELHQVIGTPTYMSPEQADAGTVDIDTRTDIYSLGVLLYELLTGSPPFDAEVLFRAGVDEMRRVIREQDPPKPSTRLSRLSADDLTFAAAHRQSDPARLATAVRGDLDSIAMKCLEKDRARRYETADALALDVGRYLAHEPILAAPPSASYRLRKFIRRNRGAAIAATTIAALLILAFLGLVVGILLVNHEREQTVAALGRETSALSRETAERTLKENALAAETRAKLRTVEALRKMTDKVVEELLGRQQQFTDREKQFLRDVQQLYEDFTREEGDTPSARAVRAEGYTRVAAIRRTFGERAAAERNMQSAVSLLANLSSEFPARFEYRRFLADAYYRHGILLDELERRTEAQVTLRRAIEINKQLIQQRPADAELHHALAVSHGVLGGSLRDVGKFKDAESEFRLSVDLHEKLTADFPAQSVFARTLAYNLNALGFTLHMAGEHAAAAEVHRRVIDIDQKLLARYPGDPEYRHGLASSHDKLGTALRELGKYSEAKAEHDLAIRGYDEVAAMHPAVPGYRVGLAGGYVNLAHVLLLEREPLASLDPYSKGIEILEVVKHQARGHASTRIYLRNAFEGRAQAYEQLGRYADAANDWRRASSYDESGTANFLIREVGALARAGQVEQAINAAKKVKTSDQTSDLSLWEAVRALDRAARSAPANVANELRRYADRFAQDSVLSARTIHAKDARSLEHALFRTGERFSEREMFAQAEPHYREMLELRHSRLVPYHDDVLSATATFARLLSEWAYSERKLSDAINAARRAEESVRLLRGCRGARTEHATLDDWRLADTESRLGFALVALAATDHTLTPQERLASLVEAELLLISSRDALQQHDRVESKYRQRAYVRIVRLYEYWTEQFPDAAVRDKAAKARGELTAIGGRRKSTPPEPADP